MSEPLPGTINTELRPFPVPNFILTESLPGENEHPKFHLRECEAETLSRLCDRFREEAFEKAEKKDPRLQ